MISQSNTIESGKVLSSNDGKITIVTKNGIVYSDSNEILKRGDIVSLKDGNIIGKLSINKNTPAYRV